MRLSFRAISLQIASVWSLDPLSDIISSKSSKSWLSKESRALRRYLSPLYTGNPILSAGFFIFITVCLILSTLLQLPKRSGRWRQTSIPAKTAPRPYSPFRLPQLDIESLEYKHPQSSLPYRQEITLRDLVRRIHMPQAMWKRLDTSG